MTSVLAAVPGLDFAWVTPQLPFQDADNRKRFADFAIESPAGIRLAIEVDGYEAHREFTQFLNDRMKTLALLEQGWQVLRFANSHFGRSSYGDGKPPEPRERGSADCARLIQLEMQRQRSVAHAAARAGESDRLRQRVHGLEATLAEARDARERATRELLAAEQHRAQAEARAAASGRRPVASEEVQRLQQEIQAAEEQLRLRDRELAAREAALAQAVAQGGAATETLSQAEWSEYERIKSEARREQERLEQELAAAEAKLEKVTGEGRTNVKLAILGIVVVAVVAVVAVAVLDGTDPPPPTPTPVNTTPPATVVAESLTLQSLTSPVRVGERATLKLVGPPATSCTIQYVTPSGTASNADGLSSRTTDAVGNIFWTWTIGSSTRTGTGTAKVSCGRANGTYTFEVVP